MKSLIVLLVLCLLPGANAAADLYRCAAPGGQASYQQSPDCPNGQRLTRVINYRPVPDQPRWQQAIGRPANPAIRHRTPTTRIRQPTPAKWTRQAHPDRQRALHACETGSRQGLERLGLKRTYEDLGRLDAPVRAACRW